MRGVDCYTSSAVQRRGRARLALAPCQAPPLVPASPRFPTYETPKSRCCSLGWRPGDSRAAGGRGGLEKPPTRFQPAARVPEALRASGPPQKVV